MRGHENDWKDLSEINRKLCEALKCKDFDLVDKLILEGANVNVYFGERVHDTPLHYFIYDTDIIAKLIKCGADIHATNDYRETPLHYTCMHFAPASTTRLLLRCGAALQINMRKRDNYTPLFSAFRNNYDTSEHEIALLRYNANVNIATRKYSATYFLSKLNSNHVFLISYMALFGYNLSQQDFGEFEREKYVLFWKQCDAEILLLKEERINETSTLFDICKSIELYDKLLEPHQRSLTKYVDGTYAALYPIYYHEIDKKYDFFKKTRSELLNKLDRIHVFGGHDDAESPPELNNDCKRHIAAYIKNFDLENFLAASTDSIKHDVNEVAVLTEIESSSSECPNKIRKLNE